MSAMICSLVLRLENEEEGISLMESSGGLKISPETAVLLE